MLENKVHDQNSHHQEQAKEQPPTTIFCYDQPNPPSSSNTANVIPFEGKELMRQVDLQQKVGKKVKRSKRRCQRYSVGSDVLLKLCEFNLAINAIEMEALIFASEGDQSDPHLAAYKFAKEQHPILINSPQFNMFFLRAENYNARKAALSMFRYLKYRFGGEKEAGRGGLQVSSNRNASESDKKVSSDRENCDGSIMNESLGTLNFSDADADSIGDWELFGLEEMGENYQGAVGNSNIGVVSEDSSRNQSLVNGMMIPATEISRSIVSESTRTSKRAACVHDRDVHPEDVLLGRGRKHAGNERFRDLVNCYFDKYESSKKQEQTKIAEEIVKLISDGGGRFLEKQSKKGPSSFKNSKMWEEIKYRKARLKVAHTFRSIRKQRKKEASKAQNTKEVAAKKQPTTKTK